MYLPVGTPRSVAKTAVSLVTVNRVSTVHISIRILLDFQTYSWFKNNELKNTVTKVDG